MRRYWLLWVLALVLMVVWTVAARAQTADRASLKAIASTLHSTSEVANVSVQMVVDTSVATLHLAQDSTWNSPIYWTQGLQPGYPAFMNLGFRLDSGKVAIWFTEWDAASMPASRHVDSTDVLYSESAPLDKVGSWKMIIPFWGAPGYQFHIKAKGGRAVGKPYRETMR